MARPGLDWTLGNMREFMRATSISFCRLTYMAALLAAAAMPGFAQLATIQGEAHDSRTRRCWRRT